MFLKYIAVTLRQILFRRKRSKQLYDFGALGIGDYLNHLNYIKS